ncbi:MAG: peptidoglycan-binding protein [Clostridiales bacterium]|jgi:peptidoglycan hydrolase-like protein with peptidoglycan-binding domain|nr:peptidoglycan-binding protein [Clostridiales bacterium]
MGSGNLKVSVHSGRGTIPINNAQVVIKNSSGVLKTLKTDSDGNTEYISLSTPNIETTLTPYAEGPWHGTYTVEVTAPGYQVTTINGVQIFDQRNSDLPVNLLVATRDTETETINIPENELHNSNQREQKTGLTARILHEVIIPEKIIVHLGTPTNNSVKNVTVPFIDYIKNVASHEPYPTWPEKSLEANIYVIITFALNRIYTEWYTSKGYNFNITNSTAYDQYYVDGGEVFENVAAIVDKIFNIFVKRQGHAEPYFTSFCNGTTSTCAGLSQWGTVDWANQGLDALQILKKYYPSDIQLVTCYNQAPIYSSFPGTLSNGSRGNNVKRMQEYLNRIRVNYPLIPEINPEDGIYGAQTQESVKVFQSIFDLSQTGTINQATWNKISSIYVAVKKLSELDSEGERIDIGNNPPTTVIRQGNRGSTVLELQFILDYLSQFYDSIPDILQNSVFDVNTTAAVKDFQNAFGLTADGIVGPSTWAKLYEIYKATKNNTNVPGYDDDPQYPGSLLKVGSRGTDVLIMQRYLNLISQVYTSIPKVTEDGIFGDGTKYAVSKFQELFGLSSDGIIGKLTWDRIVQTYDNLGSEKEKYPGYILKVGSSGDSVKLIQNYLNAISNSYPSIPKVTADGIFGSKTKEQVIAYQKIFGLSADGLVGPSTWSSIISTYHNLY